ALSAALTPGQTYLNIAGNSPLAFARIPDGGAPGDMASYVTQLPTPGYTNIPACSGALVEIMSGNIQQCTDSTNAPLNLGTNSLYGDNYLYILTDTANLLLEWNMEGVLNMDAYAPGAYHIFGLSYNGTVDAADLVIGAPIDSISASSCLSLSGNFIEVIREDCAVTGCDGGTVSLADGSSYLSFCQVDNPGVINFTHTEQGVVDQYHYFLTNADDQIIQELISETVDISALGVGEYHLFGISSFGDLLPETSEAFDLITGIQSTGGCVAVSENYIDIRVIDCEPGEGCTRVIISEYIEGTGSNKAIELYNATPFPVDLDDYDLFVYNNGNDTISGLLHAPSGILQPGATYVVCSALADAELLALANNSSASMNNFNGNDVVALAYNLEPIDMIGIPGDTVNAWTFGSGSTLNQTLRRKQEVNAPTTNWDLSAGQWLSFSNTDYSGLGNHVANACASAPYLSFEQSSVLVNEGDGTVEININAFNVQSDLAVTIAVDEATAEQGTDYTNVFPVNYTFSTGGSELLVFELVDDDVMESLETSTLLITDASGQASFVNQSITITIEDNDQTFPPLSIGEARAEDADGVLVNQDVYCTLGGIVHGVNFNPGGLEFTLIDETGGIRIFSANNNFGYSPAEGDSLLVEGQINQFMGMAEFFVSHVQFVNSGNALEIPSTVSTLSEANESHMVKLECITLVDPSEWGQPGNGFDVNVTDGTNEMVMSIDLNCDVYGTGVPLGHFTAIGIGAQMDETAPFTEGYRFFPRYLLDFSESIVSSFTMPDPIEYTDLGVEVDFTNNSTAGFPEWDFGDGVTSSEGAPAYFYSYEFLSANPQVTVSLSTTVNGCTDTQTQTVDAIFNPNSVAEQNVSFEVYPNPAGDQLTVHSSAAWTSWQMLDGSGREVLSEKKSLTGNINVSLETLAPGSYIMQLRFDSAIVSKRFIKY
ncbi:MAG: lamin tail domain-containing protein, partial [Flavobacteriales bacterium]